VTVVCVVAKVKLCVTRVSPFIVLAERLVQTGFSFLLLARFEKADSFAVENQKENARQKKYHAERCYQVEEHTLIFSSAA
jgi:hypothetical protein